MSIIRELPISFKHYPVRVNCPLCKLIGQDHYISDDIDSETKYYMLRRVKF